MTTLLITYLVFALAVASPGPATLALMSTSATMGRAAGLKLAMGITTGSIFWGVLVALGLASVLLQFSWALVTLKVVGGVYLIWLAIKALRSALTPNGALKPAKIRRGNLYWQGLALHLTNPKPLLAWPAMIAIGVPSGAPQAYLATLLIGCMLIAASIFFTYVFLFSTPRMMAAYTRLRRKLDSALAAMFGFAGLKLISSTL